jgi:hypothetical protein
MPRPTETVENQDTAVTQVVSTPAQEPSESLETPTGTNGAAEAPQAVQARRTRRTIVPPPGVTLGVMEEIQPGEPPKSATGRAGRSPDPKTLKAIETLQANPGKWYKIGVFGSAASPDGMWKNAGVTFKNVSLPEGLFERWAAIDPPKGSGDNEAA